MTPKQRIERLQEVAGTHGVESGEDYIAFLQSAVVCLLTELVNDTQFDNAITNIDILGGDTVTEGDTSKVA